MQSKVPTVPKQTPFPAFTGLFPGRNSDPQPKPRPPAKELPQQQYLVEHIDDFCDCV